MINSSGASNRIGVWCFPLEASPEVVSAFAALLSSDELDRAARFRFEHLRRSFTIARGAVRNILAACTGVRPESIRFAYSAEGKPSLEYPAAGLRFNVSHSGKMALCAAGTPPYLGIDVEQVRPMPDALSLAARFFSQEEAAELARVPPHLREQVFFTCWTRKEAYIKAVGGGLSIPLDSFRVTIMPGEPARLVRRSPAADASGEWTLLALDPAPGYIGALAYTGAPALIQVHTLPDAEVTLRNPGSPLIP
jgi:4'-phosphopantetheinyl transferase